MPDRVRVGFVGAGRIADLQCLGYLEHPSAEIVAVCDLDPDTAKRRAESWSARAYTDFELFLEDPQIDAVEILTPHHLHASQAIASLDAGKHVSLQKPPARTLEEFSEVLDAVKWSGKTFRVFENFMYYPPHQKAKALIAEGAIGEPLSIRIKTAAGRPDEGWAQDQSTLAWRMDLDTSGGGPVTFDHGYHCYNMARFFIPAEIERVHAFINWTQMGTDAWYDGPALISWKYEGTVPRFGSWEVIASLSMRVRSKYYVSDDRIEIHGTDGIIWINRCTGQLLDEPSVVVYREGETRAFHDLETDWASSFRLGTHDFIDAIIDGRQPPLNGDEARRTLSVALAAAKSAAEGREVGLSEIADRGDS